MAGGGPLHLRPPFVIAIFVSGIPSDRGHIFRRRTSASALQHSARRVAFISPDATRSSSIPYCQLRARRSGCVIYRRGGPYRPAVVIQLSPRATARLALQLQLPRPPNAIPPTAPRHSTQRPTLSYPIHPNPIPIPSHLISSGRRARSLIWSVPCAIVRPFYVLCHCVCVRRYRPRSRPFTCHRRHYRHHHHPSIPLPQGSSLCVTISRPLPLPRPVSLPLSLDVPARPLLALGRVPHAASIAIDFPQRRIFPPAAASPPSPPSPSSRFPAPSSPQCTDPLRTHARSHIILSYARPAPFSPFLLSSFSLFVPCTVPSYPPIAQLRGLSYQLSDLVPLFIPPPRILPTYESELTFTLTPRHPRYPLPNPMPLSLPYPVPRRVSPALVPPSPPSPQPLSHFEVSQTHCVRLRQRATRLLG